MILIQDPNGSWAPAPERLRYPSPFQLYRRAFFYKRRFTFEIFYRIFLKVNPAPAGQVFRSDELFTACLAGWELSNDCAAFCRPETTAQLFYQVIWVYYFVHEKNFHIYSLGEAGQRYPVKETELKDHIARQLWLFEPEDKSVRPETEGAPPDFQPGVHVVVEGYGSPFLPDGTEGWVVSVDPKGNVRFRLGQGNPQSPERVLWWGYLRIV
jgi:hypothetical protein